MFASHDEVQALPVVVPLALLAFTLLLWSLHRRRAWSVPRVLVAAITCIYGAGIIANTVFPISLGSSDYETPWRAFLNLTPLTNTDASDIALNIALFVPVGVLLPLITRAGASARVIGYGFLISLTMEAIQLVNAIMGHGGHVADINDLLANTAGVVVGYGIFRGALRMPPTRRLVDNASLWTTFRA